MGTLAMRNVVHSSIPTTAIRELDRRVERGDRGLQIWMETTNQLRFVWRGKIIQEKKILYGQGGGGAFGFEKGELKWKD